MVDLSSILGKPASEIKTQPPLPAGDYIFRITGFGTTEMDAQKYPKSSTGVDLVCFECVAEAAIDVPQEMLKDIVFPSKMRYNFYPTETSAIYLKLFLCGDGDQPSTLGFDANSGTLWDFIQQSVGKVFIATVSQSMTKASPGRESRMMSNISKTRKAE